MPSNITTLESTRVTENSGLDSRETIVAVATPHGQGGIGIVRLSGCEVVQIASQILSADPEPGQIKYCSFLDSNSEAIDCGIALLFRSPHSYTGEDILEFQGHGSPIILDLIVKRCIELGARPAEPGEFSRRAFLNGRIDLAQAEAIADLINSSTESAARSALRSMKGELSIKVEKLAEKLTELRMLIEASIDFPEEEIDYLSELGVLQRLELLVGQFDEVESCMKQGRLLRDGLKVVLTGLPNAGKSSLLNSLAKQDRAIVSDLPGTTRDTLEQIIDLDGIPMEIVDTAGIRDTQDEIEAEGVRRAKRVQQEADLVLLVVDDDATDQVVIERLLASHDRLPVLLVRNKIDLTGRGKSNDSMVTCISVKTGKGLSDLKEKIKLLVGYAGDQEGMLMARQRHIDALMRAKTSLNAGIEQLKQHQAGEMLAEDLSLCHRALAEITGDITSDELLGMIFSSFCIGK
ncbi:MAG: tRNA uridine-5-carboxymethylaminomethyl(34) synthesis GTPase MnmE [Gammaproteobacteria bacterium]|nr:tRNA uridine-5-carboxymethylaminomethyl(34) synthesis GTPase MnmE [Gammaproteobacteria bacterium]